MNNEQMDRIERMLVAQLRGAGHIWWIGGFVYGQTSNGDLFVILYPASDKLNEKVVRVYSHDFKRLPAFIPVDGVEGGDTEANPNKEQARRKGIYHECPAFEVVTFDGKETQMGRERRFGDVLRLSKAAREWTGGEERGGGIATRPTAPPDLWDDAPSATPPVVAPAALPAAGLPDYRTLAMKSASAAEFDYAVFMALRDGLYTDQAQITATRQALVPGWHPGEQSNRAMLEALEDYRDERSAAEGRGEDRGAAHALGKAAALRIYNEEIKEQRKETGS